MGLCLPTCFRNGRSLWEAESLAGQSGTLARASGSAVLPLAGSFTTNCFFATVPHERS
jgi:hypothetical protein